MELREQWSTNMPSREEMRRNRDALHATSAMNVLRWEKENKSKILEWKKIVARLEPDSDDPDLCNIERYRPSRPFVYDSTAQIAGHHAMSQRQKDNWPEEMSEPKAKTAVAHLQKENNRWESQRFAILRDGTKGHFDVETDTNGGLGCCALYGPGKTQDCRCPIVEPIVPKIDLATASTAGAWYQETGSWDCTAGTEDIYIGVRFFLF